MSRLTLFSLSIAAVLVAAAGAAARPAPAPVSPRGPAFFAPLGHVVTPGPRPRGVPALLGARGRQAGLCLHACGRRREQRHARGERPAHDQPASRRHAADRRRADDDQRRRSSLHRVPRPGLAATRPAARLILLVACSHRGAARARSVARPQSGTSRSGRPSVRVATRRVRAAAAACSSGAHTLALRRPRLSRDRQRRLHERPHRRLPGLRRADEPVPAGHPRRPDRPGDAVPDRLQPRLRADVDDERRDAGPEHDGRLGHGQRPAGDVRVRPADLPRRPERPGRSRPAGPPDRRRSTRSAPTNPNSAGVLAERARRATRRAERPAVPGEQARDHAVGADPERRDLRRHGQLHRPPRRPHRRRRHDRGLVPVEHPGRRRRLRHDRAGRHRGLDAAQQPPDARSRPTTSTTRSPPAGRRSPTASSSASTRQPARRELPRRLDDAGTGTRPSRSPNYLVENSVGALRPDRAPRRATGSIYYEAQGSAITAARKATNKAIMDQQEDITNFQSMFNGAVPVHDRRRRHRRPRTRASRRRCRRRSPSPAAIDRSLGTFNHENMHQWWGDNVSEAELQRDVLQGGHGDARRVPATRRARRRPPPAGSARRPVTRRSRRASSTGSTRTTASTGSLWTGAPSNPTPTTCSRRDHLHAARHRVHRAAPDPRRGRFIAALKQIQHESAAARSPRRSSRPSSRRTCRTRARPARRGWTSSSRSGSTPRTRRGGGANKPQITGPGLARPRLLLRADGRLHARPRRRRRARTAGTRATSTSRGTWTTAATRRR